MRVLVMIDGVEKTVSSGAEVISAVAEDASVDAGGAPGGGGSETVEAAAAMDSGPPPEWLLEAVATAEAEGLGFGQAAEASGEIADAGAAPTA